MTAHAFLTDEESKRLQTFAHIMRERGNLTAITDDGLILHTMMMNGIPKPQIQAGDHHKVVLFSDTRWSWIVIFYSSFEDGNGLGALKVDRSYLMREFTLGGDFKKDRAMKILGGLLAILQVRLPDVDIDWGEMDKKGEDEQPQKKLED